MLWIQFIICVIVIAAASNILLRYADVIAEKTGLGRAWVGAILRPGVTGLPERVSGVTAVTVLNAPNVAIGGIVGSHLFNETRPAVSDVFDGSQNLQAVMSNANVLGRIIAMMMTAVVIVSLMYRALPKTPFRVTGDGVALIAMQLGAMAALYILGLM